MKLATFYSSLLLSLLNKFHVNLVSGQFAPSPELIAAFQAPVIGCTPTAGQWIRAAFHECGTFNQFDGSGGNTGSLQFEMDRPENRGLQGTVAFYQSMMTEFSISFADAIVVGGIVAVEACGGPIMEITLGRGDLGAVDAVRLLPPPNANALQSKQIFINRMGFTAAETVALVGGGHSAARVNTANSPGLVSGPLDTTPAIFDNAYFQQILTVQPAAGTVRIPADVLLAADPELKPIYQQFAFNAAEFNAVFAQAYVKMLDLGAVFVA